MFQLTTADVLALLFFIAVWLFYAPLVRRFVPHAINTGLASLRIAWMSTMLRRENRIVDSSLIGHVVHSASFFASTSLIVIGALLSLLSNVDHLQPAVESLAFVPTVPRTVFELKIVLPLLILIHGFVSLTWSLRQLNYTIAMIGASPDRRDVGPDLDPLAAAIGRSLSQALATFNTGIRAYYFAIGGLAWVTGPVALAVAAVIIATMLVWRQRFSSASAEFRVALAAISAAHDRIGRGE